MRVTQSMLASNMLGHINRGYNRLGQLQEQLVTGKKITRPSQDPVIATQGIKYRTEVSEIKQFQRNLSEVKNWMDSADVALEETNQVIQRVRDLAVQSSNDTYSFEQRKAVSEEIENIRNHLASIANTNTNGKYIFNGKDTNNKPISLDKAKISQADYDDTSPDKYVVRYQNKNYIFNDVNQMYENGNETITVDSAINEVVHTDENGVTSIMTFDDVIVSEVSGVPTNTEEVSIEVMKGIQMDVNINPQKVFSADLFNDLGDLINTLGDPTSLNSDIEKFIGKVDVHLTNVSSERAELGARQNRVSMVEARLDQQEVFSQQILSDNEDVDLEKVIIDLTTQESVHRAALSAGSRIIQPSLVDFLR